MFPDLCWGSFNYTTYKANISLFPKWIHKIPSHVMFPCLSYTFYPPKHSESILFPKSPRRMPTNKRLLHLPTRLKNMNSFATWLWSYVTHMTYVFPRGWDDPCHNFFEFVEVNSNILQYDSCIINNHGIERLRTKLPPKWGRFLATQNLIVGFRSQNSLLKL